MPLHRMLPFYVLLLAACSAPNDPRREAAINPGPGCQEACASGYRWAVENEVTNVVKCRGENEFSRGCREAVAFAKPF